MIYVNEICRFVGRLIWELCAGKLEKSFEATTTAEFAMLRTSILSVLFVLLVTPSTFAGSERPQRSVGPDICRGRVWIKHMVAVQATSDSVGDPMSCSFDPNSTFGRRVLRVCNEHDGAAAHGCWVRGSFVVAGGVRRLIGMVEVHKLDTPE